MKKPKEPLLTEEQLQKSCSDVAEAMYTAKNQWCFVDNNGVPVHVDGRVYFHSEALAKEMYAKSWRIKRSLYQWFPYPKRAKAVHRKLVVDRLLEMGIVTLRQI